MINYNFQFITMSQKNTLKVALAQISPVWLNKIKTGEVTASTAHWYILIKPVR